MSHDQSKAHAAHSADGADAGEERAHTAGAFDIRTFIAMLIGIYGVVLVITGVVQADGRTINLVAGICMIIGAAAFYIWARLRPVVVPESVADGSGAGSGADRPKH
jgi:hypothetical protein